METTPIQQSIHPGILELQSVQLVWSLWRPHTARWLAVTPKSLFGAGTTSQYPRVAISTEKSSNPTAVTVFRAPPIHRVTKIRKSSFQNNIIFALKKRHYKPSNLVTANRAGWISRNWLASTPTLLPTLARRLKNYFATFKKQIRRFLRAAAQDSYFNFAAGIDKR